MAHSGFQVAVRIRPLLDCELGDETSIYTLSSSFGSEKNDNALEAPYQHLQIGDSESSERFTFQRVFAPSTSQREFYSECVAPLVRSCLEGYNTTIFTYGQTCSGKTHTIVGDIKRRQKGLLPRALTDIFCGLDAAKAKCLQAMRENPNSPECCMETKDGTGKKAQNHEQPLMISARKEPFEYQVKVQFVELYGELVQDMIKTDFDIEGSLKKNAKPMYSKSGGKYNSKRKKHRLIIRDVEDKENAEVHGAYQVNVRSAKEALHFLQRGMEARSKGISVMDGASTHSHTIFTVEILQIRRDIKALAKSEANLNKDLVKMKKSKIHFLDLTGSGRVRGKRMQERLSINKALFTFDNVVSALSNENIAKENAPYQDSKLTRLFKGSLGGNHKTLMVACVSPSIFNQDESSKTLRYANRAKYIINYPKVNLYPSPKVLNELCNQVVCLATEILRLRRTLSFDDRDFACPFSKYFLDYLTNLHANGSVYKPNTLPPLPRENGVPSRNRPITAPIRSIKPTQRPNYVHTSSLGSIEVSEETQEDLHRANDTKNAEDFGRKVGRSVDVLTRQREVIICYDFIITVLREILESLMNSEEKKHELTELWNFLPGLDMIRNIDELWHYLTSESSSNNNVEDSDSPNANDQNCTILEESISNNENILKQMKEQHEFYKAKALDTKEKLLQINSNLEKLSNEKKRLGIITDQLEANSPDLSEILKSVSKIEGKFSILKRERNKILAMIEEVDVTARKIRNVKKQLIMMKKKRLELKRARSSSSTFCSVAEVDSKASLRESLECDEEFRNYDVRYSDRELNRDSNGNVDSIKTNLSNDPKPLNVSKWAEPDANSFLVRSKSYLRDKSKINAGKSLFSLVAVDIIKPDNQLLTGVSQQPHERIQKALAIEKKAKEKGIPCDMPPFLFIMNLSLKGPPPFNLVFYFAIDDMSLIDGTNGTEISKLMKEFFFGDSDNFRDETFKMIPQIVKGNFIVRNAARSAPVILGTKLKQYYCGTDRYFEVTVDMGSNQVANQAIKLCNGFSKSIVVVLAFLLEAKTESTLPEKIFGCVQLKKVSLIDDCRPLGT